MHIIVDYPNLEGPLFQEMERLLCHIDCFEHQYEKAFSEYRLFVADIVDIIHKRVQVFLHLGNTTSLEDVDTGALAEFG